MKALDPAKNLVLSAVAMFGTALLGGLLSHWRLVRQGRRAFWSWDLVWEIPAAFFAGLLANGVGSYLDLPIATTTALAGAFGLLGPRWLEVMVIRIIDAKRG